MPLVTELPVLLSSRVNFPHTFTDSKIYYILGLSSCEYKDEQDKVSALTKLSLVKEGHIKKHTQSIYRPVSDAQCSKPPTFR